MCIFSGREAEYVIEEDDKYYLGIVNTNPRNIIMAMNVNVSSKMYDTTKAKSMCSTMNGSCRLSLLFPNSQFVTVTTPNNVRPRLIHHPIPFRVPLFSDFCFHISKTQKTYLVRKLFLGKFIENGLL